MGMAGHLGRWNGTSSPVWVEGEELLSILVYLYPEIPLSILVYLYLSWYNSIYLGIPVPILVYLYLSCYISILLYLYLSWYTSIHPGKPLSILVYLYLSFPVWLPLTLSFRIGNILCVAKMSILYPTSY
jgi:hypothetical protein